MEPAAQHVTSGSLRPAPALEPRRNRGAHGIEEEPAERSRKRSIVGNVADWFYNLGEYSRDRKKSVVHASVPALEARMR